MCYVTANVAFTSSSKKNMVISSLVLVMFGESGHLVIAHSCVYFLVSG